MKMGACRRDFFKLPGMVNRGLRICFIIWLRIIYLSLDGSMWAGACVWEHADGSMRMEAIILEQSILPKIITFHFFDLHKMVNRGLIICFIIC